MNVFLEEVLTQGRVLRTCLNHYASAAESPLADVVGLVRSARYRRLLFVGMGSSLYAPLAVTDFLTANGLPSVVLNASEVAGRQMGQITTDTLLVAVSQSGQSQEVVDVIRQARGRTTIVGVVNNADSPLAREADIPLFIYAGHETSISNKSYLNTLAVLNILSAALVGRFDSAFRSKLYEIADWVEATLQEDRMDRAALQTFLSGTTHYDFLGTGPSMSTAKQAALIFREGPRLTTAAINCADYAHGWKDSVAPGYTAIILDPQGEADSVEARMRAEIVKNGGKVVMVTGADAHSPSDSVYVLRHQMLPEHLAPLAQIVLLDLVMGFLMGGDSE